MPDQLTPMYFPLSAGIDTQAHPYNVRAPYLRHAQNVDYRRDIGPQKREGLAALPTGTLDGGTISNGGALAQVGDELLLGDDSALYAWAPAVQKWARRGELRPTLASTRPYAVSGSQLTGVSGAGIPALNLEACAWIDLAGVHICVQDTVTGTKVLPDVVLATGRLSVRMVATASTFVVVSMDSSAALYAVAVSPGGVVGTEGKVVSAIANAIDAAWDVASDPASGGALLMYVPGSATNFSLLQLTAGGVPLSGAARDTSQVLGTGTSLSNVIQAQLTVDTTTPGVYTEATRLVLVTRTYGSGLYGFCLDCFTGPVAAPTATNAQNTIPASTSLPAGPAQVVSYFLTQGTTPPTARTVMALPVVDGGSGFAGGPLTHNLWAGTTTFAGAGTYAVPSLLVRGVRMLSRPFTQGGRTVAWCVSSTTSTASGGTTPVNVQPTAFLVDLNSTGFSARLALGTVDINTLPGGTGTVTQLQTPYARGTQTAMAALLRTRLTAGTINNGVYSASSLVPQSGAFSLLTSSATLGQLQTANMDVAGVTGSGICYHYDGAQVTEQGFLLQPDLSLFAVDAGLGSVAVGTYFYYIIWEWYDARGRRHRSAPSNPLPVQVTAANSRVTLRTQPLLLTRRGNVSILVYRTAPDAGFASTPFLTSDPTNPYISNPSVNFQYPVDYNASAALIGNETLYTLGGELPNDAPPSSTVCFRARSRVMVAGGDYPDTLTYSKQLTQGDAVSFSLALQKRITQVPGAILGGAAVDDKIIVFKAGGIVAFNGQGVTAAGTASGSNDDFAEPIIVSTDLVLANPNSICVAAEGVYFQAQKGIYLIDRGLAPAYVGAAAAQFQTQTVRSAVLHPRLGHLRFGCLEDTAPVYHPRKVQAFGDSVAQAGAWTTYQNFGQVSATMWRGLYYLLRANGTVCGESTTAFDDDGSPVPMSIRTAWLTGTAPLQSVRFGALAVIGELISPHRLLVDLSVSYNPTPVCRLVFDSDISALASAWGSDPAWGDGPPWGQDQVQAYMFRCRQVPEEVLTASAVQWTFTDAPSTSGIMQRSASIHGYAMLMASLAGLNSLPDKQSL